MSSLLAFIYTVYDHCLTSEMALHRTIKQKRQNQKRLEREQEEQLDPES